MKNNLSIKQIIIININNYLEDTLGINIKKTRRHSTNFAIKHFKNNPITAVEIGTFKGKNAKSILKNLNIKKLYLIDPWEEYEDYIKSEKEKNTNNLNKSFVECKKRLKNWEYKIKYVREYSDSAAKKIPLVDFVYIDGNHEYNYVLNDINNYYTKVKKGGILAGHDIDWGNQQVLNALIDFCKKKNISFHVSGECWWILK